MRAIDATSAQGLGRVKTRMRRDSLEQDLTALVFPRANYLLPALPADCKPQDGLVHVSELADRFVKDPRDVVKAGDVVRVRVKDVDVERKRIALTMKSGAVETKSAGLGRESNVERTSPAPSAQRSNTLPSATRDTGRCNAAND
jgi:predicted RNA-binding protein with RPS1 domain